VIKDDLCMSQKIPAHLHMIFSFSVSFVTSEQLQLVLITRMDIGGERMAKNINLEIVMFSTNGC
jgi:hypothetical protein